MNAVADEEMNECERKAEVDYGLHLLLNWKVRADIGKLQLSSEKKMPKKADGNKLH